jgi:pimeloyl-ACP methyl ester carboxylesterase
VIEKVSSIQETARVQNVKFAAPLLDYGYPPAVRDDQSQKPILLYLPGFDGTYICPFIQFPELGDEFEVWCMTVGMSDRSTFQELTLNVLEFIQEITATTPETSILEEERTSKSSQTKNSLVTKLQTFFSPNSLQNTNQRRPIYLAGESFGGILASKVALLLQSKQNINLKGLTLINPATSYNRCALREKGQSTTKLPGLLYPFGLIKLLPLFTDEFSFQQLLLILSADALPSVIDTPAREAYMGRVAISLPFKLEYMPQQTLNWRLTEWLEKGCQEMEQTMKYLSNIRSLPTLIIAGEKDNTLPSMEEAERLSSMLPNSRVHVVQGAGHASTCGSRVDLTAIMRSSFPELQSDDTRMAMKPQASNGSGPYFGMTERYDGANIGLNPLLYWSNDNFQSTKQTVKNRTHGCRIFSKTDYSTS